MERRGGRGGGREPRAGPCREPKRRVALSGRRYRCHPLGAARRGGHWINTSKLHVPAIVIFAERLLDMILPPRRPSCAASRNSPAIVPYPLLVIRNQLISTSSAASHLSGLQSARGRSFLVGRSTNSCPCILLPELHNHPFPPLPLALPLLPPPLTRLSSLPLTASFTSSPSSSFLPPSLWNLSFSLFLLLFHSPSFPRLPLLPLLSIPSSLSLL